MMIVYKQRLWLRVILGILIGMSVGCVHQLRTHPAQEELREPIVYGQIEVWQKEPSGRIFPPELAAFEFIAENKGQRYRVQIEASSSFFFLSLLPGHYQMTRVFIQEGGFRASAEVPLEFEVPQHGVAYLGKWRFHIGSPHFMRKLQVKVASEPLKALVELRVQYPSVSLDSVETRLAEPVELRARLYEITPYPRFRWFNRQRPT